jgi:hypothetical protein
VIADAYRRAALGLMEVEGARDAEDAGVKAADAVFAGVWPQLAAVVPALPGDEERWVRVVRWHARALRELAPEDVRFYRHLVLGRVRPDIGESPERLRTVWPAHLLALDALAHFAYENRTLLREDQRRLVAGFAGGIDFDALLPVEDSDVAGDSAWDALDEMFRAAMLDSSGTAAPSDLDLGTPQGLAAQAAVARRLLATLEQGEMGVRRRLEDRANRILATGPGGINVQASVPAGQARDVVMGELYLEMRRSGSGVEDFSLAEASAKVLAERLKHTFFPHPGPLQVAPPRPAPSSSSSPASSQSSSPASASAVPVVPPAPATPPPPDPAGR